MEGVGHFEIPADDKGKAKEFYGSAFGWKLLDVPMKMGGRTETYTTATTVETDPETMMPAKPGGINGAIIERTSELKTPVITIVVDSIDESLKRIGEAGGKTVEDKQEVEGMGYYAYFTDPVGNVMGLWENMPKK